MDGTVYIISTLSIFFIVPIMLGILAARTEDKENPTTIRQSMFFLWFGIFGVAFILFFTILYFFLPEDPNESRSVILDCILNCILIFGWATMFALSLWMILFAINWRLIFDEDALIYKNIFGIKRRYQYSEISKIYACYNLRTKRLEKYRLYVGKRKVTVECLAKNFGSFERLIKKRLKSAKNPIKIEVKETKF